MNYGAGILHPPFDTTLEHLGARYRQAHDDHIACRHAEHHNLDPRLGLDEVLNNVEAPTCYQRATGKMCMGCGFCDPRGWSRAQRRIEYPLWEERFVIDEIEGNGGW